jgi:putative tricarboxylic transport membrane protein
MRRIYQVVSVVFFIFGIFIVAMALNLTFYTAVGPGPGFFPFWVGLSFTVLSVIWFCEVTFKSVQPMPANFVPERSGQLRMLAILGALVASVWLVNRIGFSLTIFPFLLFTISVLGGQRPVVTIVVALAGSFGVSYVFSHFLDVYLPTAPIALLNRIGF